MNIGSSRVATDASGMATFTFTGASTDPLKDGSTSAYFTATATSPDHATSEFSSAVRLYK